MTWWNFHLCFQASNFNSIFWQYRAQSGTATTSYTIHVVFADVPALRVEYYKDLYDIQIPSGYESLDKFLESINKEKVSVVLKNYELY